MPGRALVDGLEEALAPGAVVDLPAPQAAGLRAAVPVDAAGPGEVAGAVVALGPLALQQRLGLAVLELLLQVAAHAVAAVVPDDGAGAEADASSPAPAGASRCRRRRPRSRNCGSKPPIASRLHLRKAMLQPGMCSAISSESSTWIGPARRVRHALGGLAVSRTAGCSGRRCRRGSPSGRRSRGARASTGPGGRRRRCRRRSRRSRRCRPALRAFARPRFSVLIRRNPYSRVMSSVAVGGAVVDDDHLVVGVLERPQAVEAVAERVARRCRCRRRPRSSASDALAANGRLGEGAPDRLERLLRLALAVDEPEGPVVDLEAAAVPLVGPGEHERARAAGGERGAHLPVERARLRGLAVPERVEAGLGEHAAAGRRRCSAGGRGRTRTAAPVSRKTLKQTMSTNGSWRYSVLG